MDRIVSKLQASIIGVNPEFTAALANVNIGLTLFKVEAPKQYHGLGERLSVAGRDNSPALQTAGKLAILFKGICADTPKLIAAYCTRVSEVAE
jgi:hypothetical protein